MLARLLFDRSRAERGLLVGLLLLGVAAAMPVNSEEFKRYMRMRSM
jgi:hypothetical protein